MVCLTSIDTEIVDDEGLKQLLSVLVGSPKFNMTDCMHGQDDVAQVGYTL